MQKFSGDKKDERRIKKMKEEEVERKDGERKGGGIWKRKVEE